MIIVFHIGRGIRNGSATVGNAVTQRGCIAPYRQVNVKGLCVRIYAQGMLVFMSAGGLKGSNFALCTADGVKWKTQRSQGAARLDEGFGRGNRSGGVHGRAA